jgi:hypothetical protein
MMTALLSATGAFATVTCGTPVDNGGGSVSQTVTSTNTMVGVVFEGTGGATGSNGTCIMATSECTWEAQGTPGAGPQTVTATFTDDDGEFPCTVTNDDGLPVELVEFSVE